CVGGRAAAAGRGLVARARAQVLRPPRRRSSVASATEYSFRHVLVRNVAHGQIPRAARAEKHRRAAVWIESLGRPDDHAELIAHHYLWALEFARAAGRKTVPLSVAARRALRGARDRAARSGPTP